MENVRLQKLHPEIRGQEDRMEAMRQVLQMRHARYEQKMAQYAKSAQDKAAHTLSLKHDFTNSAHVEPAPGSIFPDVVSTLRDDRTGKVLVRVPTQATMELGRKARRENVQRILDLLI